MNWRRGQRGRRIHSIALYGQFSIIGALDLGVEGHVHVKATIEASPGFRRSQGH